MPNSAGKTPRKTDTAMSRWSPSVALAGFFACVYRWVTAHAPPVSVLLIFVGVAILSRLMVGVMRSLALERMLDLPNERSSHSSPTPRGGGISIVILALSAVLIAAVLSPGFDVQTALLIALTSSGIAAIGFQDDFRSLGTRVRLLTHLFAAALVTAILGPIDVIAVLTGLAIDFRWLAWALTIMWIAGLTNAYNFMDGIDGIAASQAVIAALSWAVVGALSSNSVVVVLGIAVAGGSAGFLWHNWPPAQIFMGDVGSGFLGFLFATLMVLAAQSEPRAVIAGVLFVWPFVFDSTFTFFRRAYRRENVFQPHRSHLYQRLVIAGASHKTVTTIYAILGCVCSVTGILFYRQSSGASVLLPVVTIGTGLGLYLLARRAESRKNPDAARPGAEGTPVGL